jgi:predicted MFS family arabinose efflux permease
LSNATAGYVVQWFGYPSGFLYLAAVACCALAFFAFLMPETKPPARVGEPGAMAQPKVA